MSEGQKLNVSACVLTWSTNHKDPIRGLCKVDELSDSARIFVAQGRVAGLTGTASFDDWHKVEALVKPKLDAKNVLDFTNTTFTGNSSNVDWLKESFFESLEHPGNWFGRWMV